MIRRRHGSPLQQAGVAVITALLVVTIATILAVEIAWNTNLDLRRTAGVMAYDQAREYAHFGESVAIGELERLLQEKQYYDRSTDQQARRGLSIAQDDKSLAGGFSDLQGRFNLNNLVTRQGKPDELVVKQYRRLIEAVASLNPELQVGRRRSRSSSVPRSTGSTPTALPTSMVRRMISTRRKPSHTVRRTAGSPRSPNSARCAG